MEQPDAAATAGTQPLFAMPHLPGIETREALQPPLTLVKLCQSLMCPRVKARKKSLFLTTKTKGDFRTTSTGPRHQVWHPTNHHLVLWVTLLGLAEMCTPRGKQGPLWKISQQGRRGQSLIGKKSEKVFFKMKMFV